MISNDGINNLRKILGDKEVDKCLNEAVIDYLNDNKYDKYKKE